MPVWNSEGQDSSYLKVGRYYNFSLQLPITISDIKISAACCELHFMRENKY